MPRLVVYWFGATFLATLTFTALTPAPSYADPMVFEAVLSGANEVPPTGSPATGFATVTLNGNTLSVNETFSGMTTAAAAAHIHCCAPVGTVAIVAVPFPGFPSATSGTYSMTFDLTQAATYNLPFITANGGTAASAETAFITGLESTQTYVNIHSSVFPGGETAASSMWLRNPRAYLLVGLGGLGLAWGRRMRGRAPSAR
jgi:hypothetical protein